MLHLTRTSDPSLHGLASRVRQRGYLYVGGGDGPGKREGKEERKPKKVVFAGEDEKGKNTIANRNGIQF